MEAKNQNRKSYTSSTSAGGGKHVNSRGPHNTYGAHKPRLQSSMVAAPKPVDLPSIRKETLSIDAPDPSPPSNANVGWGATNKPSIAAAATSDSMEGGKASSLVSAATSTPGSTPTTSVWGAKISGAAIVQRSIIQEPNANDRAHKQSASSINAPSSNSMISANGSTGSGRRKFNDAALAAVAHNGQKNTHQIGQGVWQKGVVAGHSNRHQLKSVDSTWIDDSEMDFSELPVFDENAVAESSSPTASHPDNRDKNSTRTVVDERARDTSSSSFSPPPPPSTSSSFSPAGAAGRHRNISPKPFSEANSPPNKYPNEESNAIVGHNHHGRNETRNGWNRADNRIDDGAHGQQGRDGSDGANYHNRRPIFDGGGYNSRPQSGDRPFSGSFAGRGDIREDQRLWKNPRDNHPSDDHHHNNNYRNDQQHRSNWRRGDGHHHQHQNYHQQPDTRGARQGEQPAMNWKKGQGGGAVNDLSPSNPPKSTPSKGLVASAPTTEQVSFKVKKREVDIVAEKAVKSASTSLVAASQDHPPQQYSSTSSTSKTKSPVETKAIATTGKDTDTCSKYAIAVISSTSASSSPVPLKSTTQSPTAHTSTAAIKPKEIEGWKKPTATVVFPEEVNGVTRTKESVMVNNPSGKKRNDKEVTNPYLKIEDFDTVMVNIRKMMAKSATTATTTTSDTLQTDTGNSITSFTTAAVSIIPQSRSSSRSASECPAKKSVSDDVENWRDRPAPDVIEVHDYKARAGAQQTRNQKTGWSSLPSSKTNRFTEDSKSKSRDSAMSVDVGEVAEIEQQQQQQQKSSTKETSSDASKEIAPLIKNHIPNSVNISNSKFSQDGRRVKSASNPKSSGNLLSSDELDTTATLEHAGNIKNTIVSPDHRAVESIMRNESSVSHSLPAGYNGAVIPIAVSKDGLNHSSKQQQQVALMSSTSPAPTHHYQQQHQNHMHHQAPVMSWYPINQVWHGNGNYEIHQNHTMYPHQMQFVPIAPFQPTGSWPMTGRNTATTTSGTASTISASAVVATHTSVHDLSISSPHQHIHHKHHQMYQQPPPQQQQQVPQPHHLSHAPNIMHHPPPHHHPHPTYHHHIPVVHMVQAPANWVDKKSDQKNAKNVTHSNQQKAAAAAGGAAQNFPQQQPFTSNSSFYGATESGFVLNSFGQQQISSNSKWSGVDTVPASPSTRKVVSVNKAKIAAGTIKPMAEPPKEAADLVKDGNVVATAAVSSGHSQRRHQSPQPRIKDFDVGVEVGIRRGGGGAGFNSRGSSRGSRRGGGSSNRGGSSSGSGVGGSSSETSSKTVGGLKVVFSTKSSASPSTAG